MTYKILGSTWLSTNLVSGSPVNLGVVAVTTDGGKWKCYLGPILGSTEEADEQYVAAYGAKLPQAVACAWFPYWSQRIGPTDESHNINRERGDQYGLAN